MSKDRKYEIGYGRPPQYTQFKKGKSGNPKGRPRKTKPSEVIADTDLDDCLRRLSNLKMTIKIGGVEKEVPLYEAILMKQQANALAGSVTAQRDFLNAKAALDANDALRKAAAEQGAKEQAERKEKERQEMYDYLVRLHADQTAVYEQASDAGESPAPQYPHPDDFRFDHHARTARIEGPWDAEHARHIKKLAWQRDYHLVDHIILLRQRPIGSKFHRKLSVSLMVSYDVMLPNRQQLCGDALAAAFNLLYAGSMRDLRNWREELNLRINLNPLPEPSKKARKETYKLVNKIMKPIVKPLGFRSLAEFESHYES